MASERKYSCETASKTREWILAIIDFLKPYRFFLDAHVVNFFKDRLWEAVDKEWIDCLRKEPVQNLLQIPSGVVQDYWPASLKNFILCSKALAIPREQADLQKVLPDLQLTSLNNVLTQGMNRKKKHEIEALAAIVNSVARSIGARTIVDVGSGQNKGEYEHSNLSGQVADKGSESPLLLAGLHACGDLSVTMLRTFLGCDEVKAVVSIGCCYNLLSEGGPENFDSQHGFPMSEVTKDAGLLLGKSSRDLACQSAERWRGMERDAGLHNFELHSFRAAFQMVLFRYYPEILITSPAIGRQGKALRRQQNRRIIESTLQHESTDIPNSLPQDNFMNKGHCLTPKLAEAGTGDKMGACDSTLISCGAADYVGSASAWGTDFLLHGFSFDQHLKCKDTNSMDKYSLFEKFSLSGLHRLGLHYSEKNDIIGVWKEVEPFAEFIGPYWSLRATLGPVLETILLLDRLLFLQEQGNSLEAIMLPVFNPMLSPRNVALIAKKI